MVATLLRQADHQYLCRGHSRGIPSVPGSFSDPRPAGLLMVMVITGPNCEQWNYEISKFAATMLLVSTHARSFPRGGGSGGGGSLPPRRCGGDWQEGALAPDGQLGTYGW